jgi:hypothetical protein
MATSRFIESAIRIIKDGNCDGIRCAECPLREVGRNNCTYESNTHKKRYAINYLVHALGEQKTKELITEALV